MQLLHLYIGKNKYIFSDWENQGKTVLAYKMKEE